ncbi:MAG: hypothetical protein NUW37_09130, partial [Planctomycetes bacterium]|nr:hypothetical protein [Planctomycetota bacterium]
TRTPLNLWNPQYAQTFLQPSRSLIGILNVESWRLRTLAALRETIPITRGFKKSFSQRGKGAKAQSGFREYFVDSTFRRITMHGSLRFFSVFQGGARDRFLTI